MQAKLQKLAEKIHTETLERYKADILKHCPESAEFPWLWEKPSEVKVIPGKKYTKVDVGSSGKYMVVNDTGEIYGIKGYGVIHRGHYYGTLDTIDEWYWGEYTAIRKGMLHRVVLTT